MKIYTKSAGLLTLLILTVLSFGLIYFLKSPPPGQWVREENRTVYQDREGTLLTGWQTIGEQEYYFHADGSLATGWTDLDGSRIYFDDQGIRASGWHHIDSRLFFLENGIPQTGWQQFGEDRRYFHEDGTLATGMTQIDEDIYLFSDDGAPFTGPLILEDTRYLFLEDGRMAKGWADYQGFRYYAMENGLLFTGWMQDGEYLRYFHPDGAMATGETFVDGEQLYFTPEGIQVTLVNPWHTMPANYRVDPVTIDDPYTVDRACYDALVRMLDACADAGYEALICSGYRTQEEQAWLYDRKVNYYLEEGLEEENAKKLAGKSVAVPGTSEHQLGLAVDIVSTDYYVLDESQATTKTQQWLMEHCWEYGFILRYPDDKSEITGIIYEPWHYRYVGTAVSLPLRDSGLCLEEYLGAVTGENS